MNPYKIHTQGGFLESNPNPEFWDWQSERFFGEGFEKIIFDRRFFEKKKGTQQMLYMYDFLTEPMLVAPYQFSAISYISFHVCYLFKLLVDCF